jgi:hypothetical protein
MVLKGVDINDDYTISPAIADVALPNLRLASIRPDSHGCFYSGW